MSIYIQYERIELEISTVQWGLHLQISSTAEPLMRISFHLKTNNNPKNSKNVKDIKNGLY